MLIVSLRSVWKWMAPHEGLPLFRALTWVAFVMPLALAAQTIVPAGSEWRYLADGTDQGTNWRGAAFEDANWPAGSAPLGFGEDNLATTMTSGGGPITTYFRLKFTVADWRAFRTLTMRVRFDDGVLVYLNNRVIGRANLPSSGLPTRRSPAMTNSNGDSLVRRPRICSMERTCSRWSCTNPSAAGGMACLIWSCSPTFRRPHHR